MERKSMAYPRQFVLLGVLLSATLASTVAMAAEAEAEAEAEVEAGEKRFHTSVSGLYVSPMDPKLSGTLEAARYSSEVRMDRGAGLTVAVGYGAELGLRGELEIGYQSSDFREAHWHFLGREELHHPEPEKRNSPLEGPLDSLSLMVNGIYAFEAGRFRPYFGMGVGLTRLDAEFDTKVHTPDNGQQDLKVSGDDIVLAAQAMGGIGFPISQDLEFRLGYRYFGASKASIDGVETNYAAHMLEAGLLVRF